VVLLISLLILIIVIVAVEQNLTETTTNATEPSVHKDLRNRIRVENTDEDFSDPDNRVLEWYILRVEDSK